MPNSTSRVSVFCVAAAAAFGLSGCFIELNGGLVSTKYTAPEGSTANLDLKGSYAIGVSGGVAYDYDKKVRGALLVGADGVLLKNGDASASSTATGFGGRIDYTFKDLDDTTKLRATLGALFGTKSKLSSDGGGGADSSGYTDIFGGVSIAFYDDGAGSNFMLTAGPKYVHSKGDWGSLTSVGLHLGLTYTWVPGFAGSGGGGGDVGTYDGMYGFESTMPDDTNVIPALVAAAQRSGCNGAVDGQTMVADCPGGRVMAGQKGRTVLRLCAKGMSSSQCKAVWNNVLSNVEVK